MFDLTLSACHGAVCDTVTATIRVEADIHCVTRWTKLDAVWEGVAFREVASRARPTAGATFVMQHAYGDYTTNLPLDELMDDDVVLAYRFGGEPLAAEQDLIRRRADVGAAGG